MFIIDQFSRLTKVSDELRDCLLKRTTQLKVAKGEHLHSAGNICDRTFWVMKGLLRTYHLKEGKEITDRFAAENESLTSVRSFMTNMPDQCYLQAIEDSELYALTYTDLMYMFDHFSEMERYGRIVMSIYYVKLSERLESYQFTSAKEKYDHFCKTYKSILGRLPLGMVASYLGISQETLSRIRGRS
jgi:CRP-like cAMP-binding protein